jgi:hypothetical protein
MVSPTPNLTGSESSRKPPSRRTVVNASFLLIAGSALYLYLNLFMFPTVAVAPYKDAANCMENAIRILCGQVMYRDFFQFTGPGTESVYWLFFHIFGVRAWIGDALLVALGTALAWLSVVISRKVLKGSQVYLPGVLFLTFMFRSMPDAKEAWFAMLAVMAALAVVLGGRSLRRLAVAGVLCGVASCFNQVSGVAGVLAICVFLHWGSRKVRGTSTPLFLQQVILVAACLGTLVAGTAYFAWKAGLGRFFYCTVVFGSKYYRADIRWNSFAAYFSILEIPRFHPWWRLPALFAYLFPHLLLPLVYVLLVVAWWWRKVVSERSKPALMLISLYGVFLFLIIAVPAPGSGSLALVSLPGLVLLVWLATTWGKFGRVLTNLLWLGGLLLALGTAAYTQVRWRGYLNTPVGRMAMLDRPTFEKCRWVIQKIRPGRTLYEGGDRIMYFVLGLPNPAPVPFITGTDYTRPEQVQDVITALKTKPVQFVFWQPDLIDAGVPSSQNHLGPLRDYLLKHFHLATTFEDLDQVWERNQDP